MGLSKENSDSSSTLGLVLKAIAKRDMEMNRREHNRHGENARPAKDTKKSSSPYAVVGKTPALGLACVPRQGLQSHEVEQTGYRNDGTRETTKATKLAAYDATTPSLGVMLTESSSLYPTNEGIPSGVDKAIPVEGGTQNAAQHTQGDGPVFPGAVAVDGSYDSVWGFTNDIDSPEPATSSAAPQHQTNAQVQEDPLVSATLVEEEEEPPLALVQAKRMPCWYNRCVQVVMLLLVVCLIVVIAVLVPRFLNKDDTTEPEEEPGILKAELCSEDQTTGNFGDFCSNDTDCLLCPDGRLSVCPEGKTIDELVGYCDEISTTLHRPCGGSPCSLKNLCVPCEYYTPTGSLSGHVCLPPGSTVRHRGLRSNVGTARRLRGVQVLEEDSTAETDGYLQCQVLNGQATNPPSPPATVPPTAPSPTSTSLPPTTSSTMFPTSASTISPADEAALKQLLSDVSLDDGEALNTGGSPQNQAFGVLLRNPNLAAYSDGEKNERYALSVFYFSTGGEQWTELEGWLSVDGSVCEWALLECDATLGTVASIRAPSNNLVGSLPVELHLLETLDFLGFYSNQLSSTLPTALGLLSNLVNLDLDSNDVSGTIPSELGLLLNAEYLYLNNNRLGGMIPKELGNLKQLKSLILSNNDLTGSVPQGVCDLGLNGQLQVLSVDPEVECGCSAFAGACHPIGS